jgi:hypothetical protein
MAAEESPIPAALPPWNLRGTIYTFVMHVSAKDAEVLASNKSFIYSPLEASSSFATDKFVGGLATVQVIRYLESPVGPYDEFLISTGAFEYGVEVERNSKKEVITKKNTRTTRIYVSQKQTCWNGRTSRVTSQEDISTPQS